MRDFVWCRRRSRGCGAFALTLSFLLSPALAQQAAEPHDHSQHGAPPITTQRPTLAPMPGLRCKAKATFVKGPRVTKTRPGLDSIVEMIASRAGSFSCDFLGGG